jgi:hypothetical protein
MVASTTRLPRGDETQSLKIQSAHKGINDMTHMIAWNRIIQRHGKPRLPAPSLTLEP